MAPLAETATARMKVQYRAGGANHWAMLRYPRGTQLAGMESDFLPTIFGVFEAFMNEGMLMEDFQWLQVQYAGTDDPTWQQGANLPGAIIGTVALNTLTPSQRATHTKFTARGGGRTANLTLFGIRWVPTSLTDPSRKGIVFGAEHPAVNDAAILLNASTSVTISNGAAVWKGQANVKVNDYWRDEFKSSV